MLFTTGNEITEYEVALNFDWPPDYDSVYKFRLNTLNKILNNQSYIESAKKYYSTRPIEFICHWMDTYNPRNKGKKWIPFILFPKQVDAIHFFHSLRADQENGLVEKSRDMGATWLACAYSVWSWLFIPDDAIGWGSRKEKLVDTLGNPDSIFEKMRLLIKRLPVCFLPEGFTERSCCSFMKILNPENGAIITGDSGDNIGRGGRSSMFFKDEAAHYLRAEKIEAALGDTTDVQVDISSVYGTGTVFHRRREQGQIWSPDAEIPKGVTRVLIMDWSDHPDKTRGWYETRKAKYEREGMAHIFAQEVDRCYTAAVENVVIPAEWVTAAVDAHLKMEGYSYKGEPVYSGLDVADGGGDKNALTIRQDIVLLDCKEWGERDAGVTTRKTLEYLTDYKKVSTQYDCIGVGSGVKTEYNRLTEDTNIINTKDYPFIPWHAGAKIRKPFERIIPDDNKSPLNKDFYENFKAQAWWSLRTRFYKTYKFIVFGEKYDYSELISIKSDIKILEQLKNELSQPVYKKSTKMKMIIDKAPGSTKSPNLADSCVMAFNPIEDKSQIVTGSYGY